MNKRNALLCALITLCAPHATTHAVNDPFGLDALFEALNGVMHDRPQRSHRWLIAMPSQQAAPEEAADDELDTHVHEEDGVVIIEVDAPGAEKQDVTVEVNRAKNAYNVKVERVVTNKKSSRHTSPDGSMHYQTTSWSSGTQLQQRTFSFPEGINVKNKKVEIRLKPEEKPAFEEVEVLKIEN